MFARGTLSSPLCYPVLAQSHCIRNAAVGELVCERNLLEGVQRWPFTTMPSGSWSYPSTDFRLKLCCGTCSFFWKLLPSLEAAAKVPGSVSGMRCENTTSVPGPHSLTFSIRLRKARLLMPSRNKKLDFVAYFLCCSVPAPWASLQGVNGSSPINQTPKEAPGGGSMSVKVEMDFITRHSI